MLEYVYKQGRYTFAFAHYQVSFGNLRGIVGGVAGGGGGKAKNCCRNFFNALLLNTGRQRPYTPPLEGVASNEVQPAQAQPSPRLAKNSPLDCFCPALQGRSLRGRLPLFSDKIPPAKSLLKKSNACYTIVVFS